MKKSTLTKLTCAYLSENWQLVARELRHYRDKDNYKHETAVKIRKIEDELWDILGCARQNTLTIKYLEELIETSEKLTYEVIRLTC